jgi:small subunit ribosomal protein S16
MAVKIRLKRIGKKKMPFYRIVVADSRSPRDGRFIEEIGTYNPHTDPSSFKINEEAAQKWLSNGAQPTDVVARIFKVAGIGKGSKPSGKQESKQGSGQVGVQDDGQESLRDTQDSTQDVHDGVPDAQDSVQDSGLDSGPDNAPDSVLDSTQDNVSDSEPETVPASGPETGQDNE